MKNFLLEITKENLNTAENEQNCPNEYLQEIWCVKFNNYDDIDDWYDIPTPYLQSILDYQFEDNEYSLITTFTALLIFVMSLERSFPGNVDTSLGPWPMPPTIPWAPITVADDRTIFSLTSIYYRQQTLHMIEGLYKE